MVQELKKSNNKKAPAIRLEMPLKNNPARQQAFLDDLATFGIPSHASRAASPFAIGNCLRTFNDLRASDPEFAVRWGDALVVAHDSIKLAAYIRGIEGVKELVIQGGKIVKDDEGNPIFKTVYSDKLLDKLLNAHPEYGAKKSLEVSGEVSHSHRDDSGRLYISESDLFSLGLFERKQLVSILHTISESRGETLAVDRLHAADAHVIDVESNSKTEPRELMGEEETGPADPRWEQI